MSDESKQIYALYFDADGNGPTVLHVKPYAFDDLKPQALGLQLELSKGVGNFNMNNAPIGAGLFFTRRENVAELHRQLGVWLDAHPETP